MSSRGATHKGAYHPTKRHLSRSRKGQRNRKLDRNDGVLCDFSFEQLQYHVDKCRSKTAHKSYGAAYQAKLDVFEKSGKDVSIYECPICGKWHLTSHPWSRI